MLTILGIICHSNSPLGSWTLRKSTRSRYQRELVSQFFMGLSTCPSLTMSFLQFPMEGRHEGKKGGGKAGQKKNSYYPMSLLLLSSEQKRISVPQRPILFNYFFLYWLISWIWTCAKSYLFGPIEFFSHPIHSFLCEHIAPSKVSYFFQFQVHRTCALGLELEVRQFWHLLLKTNSLPGS